MERQQSVVSHLLRTGPSAIRHLDSTQVKQQDTEDQTNTEIFPPTEKEPFPVLTSSRGNLHVLLSSSVLLIFPLNQDCLHVKSKVQIQTDRPWSTKQWLPKHEKKKTTTLLHCPPARPLWNSTAPDRADKVVDQLWWAVVHSSSNVDLLKYVHKTLQL